MPDPNPAPEHAAPDSRPPQSPAAPPPAPVTKPRRRVLSPIWIIPLVAAALGLWLVVKYYSSKGPSIEVNFETAEGIIAGKTPVLCRSVNIGTVSGVKLSDDLKTVLVTLDMTHDATRLLVTDTQIWVVRARYSSAGISGLNTIVSGNYIELQPGQNKEPRRSFTGLENPPVTPPGVPGLRLRLVADAAGSLGPGASIIYKGIDVGKIETRTFHAAEGTVEFTAFINGEYGNLVDRTTRFWNYSGIDVKVGSDGFKIRSGTLTTILAGGITFSEPETHHPKNQHLPDNTSFHLYGSYDEANRVTDLNPTLPYLLLFTGSVRGLTVDAPVEFRGIRVGTVMGVSFKYLPADPARRVPVLIKLDPTALLNIPGDEYEIARDRVSESVERGLRATLKTGNLLTAQLYVDLDFQKDAAPDKIAEVDGYDVMPTVASGLGELQEKLNGILDKVQALPLEKTVASANDALVSLKATLQSATDFLGSKETQALPGDLRKDLAELQKTLSGYNGQSAFYQNLSGVLQQLTETLRSLKTLTGTLERSPNSIIFGKPGNPEPPRGSR